MRPPILLLVPALLLLMACQALDRGGDVDQGPAPTHPELAARLLELFETDQAARHALIEAMQDAEPGPDGSMTVGPEHLPLVFAVQAADAASTAFLRETIAATGWPTHDQVGIEAAHAAWLLAQHADDAPDLQQEVLELMEPLVAAGQAQPSDFAYLTDRVLAGRGQAQRYGTQFAGDARGVQRPQALEDPERVDQLRASVGLPPLAEYAEQLREAYGGEVSLEPLDAP